MSGSAGLRARLLIWATLPGHDWSGGRHDRKVIVTSSRSNASCGGAIASLNMS